MQMKNAIIFTAVLSAIFASSACAKTNTKYNQIQQNAQNQRQVENVPVMSCELMDNGKISIHFNKKEIAYKYAIQDETGKVKTFSVKADEVEQHYATDGYTGERMYDIATGDDNYSYVISLVDKSKNIVRFTTFDGKEFVTTHCKKNTISVNPKALRYGQENADRKDFGEVYVYE